MVSFMDLTNYLKALCPHKKLVPHNQMMLVVYKLTSNVVMINLPVYVLVLLEQRDSISLLSVSDRWSWWLVI